MRLRPLNDTVIIDPDTTLVAVDNDQTVLDAIKSNIILLPDKNMVMKISNRGKVVTYGPKCHYKFKQDQEIIYDQFADTPMWYEDSGKRYRIIKYHYIQAVCEDD